MLMFSFNKPTNDTKLYDVLGVNKTSSIDEIKKAYKKLALKHHPDRNKTNKEQAEEQFKKISAAHEALSNPEKREMYDKYGMEGIKSMHESSSGGSPFDIFEQLFSGGGGSPFGGGGSPFGGGGSPFGGGGGRGRPRTRGQDRIEKLDVSLEEIYNNKEFKINLNQKVICMDCNGRGANHSSSILKCDECYGTGSVMRIMQVGPGMISQSSQKCVKCNGKGKRIKAGDECKICEGKKVVSKNKTIFIELYNGIKHGDKIVKQEEANHVPEADQQGDLIFIIHEKPHPLFKREGDNLIIKHNILLVESLCGTNIPINHLDNRKLLLKTNKIIDPYSRRCIPKEGMPKRNGGNGDLIIDFNIKFPSSLTDERRTYLKKLLPKSSNKDYDLKEYSVTSLEYYENNLDDDSNTEQEEIPIDSGDIGCAQQ